MAYYPPNFYSNYSQQQQFPQYQYQPPQQQNNIYTGLQGKIVDSEDMVKVIDVPIGGYGVFPKADLSEDMVEINREQWLIKFSQPNDVIFLTENGNYTVGVCDDATKTIYLSNTLSGKFLKKVLCHELVHAAMFSYNIELEYKQEELLANIIATYGEEIIQITNDVFKRLRQ